MIKNSLKIKTTVVALLLGISTAHAQTYCFTSPQGYGAGTTGGGNATPVTVTTQSALQSALTASGSGVILVSGTISCSYMSLLVTNKTLLGLPGARLRNLDQTAAGSGILNLKDGTNNFIIRNLIFEGPGAYDVDGRDNLTNSGGTKIWVDHCEFQDGMDGNFDHKNTADNITVSWCKFTYLKAPKAGGSGGTDDHRFTNLVGSSDSDKPSDGQYSITWQYCWWAAGCVERMTRARNAQLHMLNCYWNSSVAKVALGLGGVTDCYVENSTFANTGDKYRYYDNGTVRLTTTGCTAPPANVGNCPAPSYTHEAISASTALTAITGSCGAGATLNVTSSGAVSANSSCNSNPTCTATVTASGSTSFCQGGSVVLTASAGSSYVWKNNGTQVGTSQTYTATAAGSYTVDVTCTNGAKATSTATTVTITTAATWYADTDGDGTGDASSTKSSCTQPTGYVAKSGDQCPNDANKIAPGDCGCGKVEGSCTDCAGVANGTAVLDNCTRCVGGNTGKQPCSASVQAEEACETSTGSVVESDPAKSGFLGSGYVNTPNATGTYAIFGITAANAGNATIGFRYGNTGTINRTAALSVNSGATAANYTFVINAASATYWVVEEASNIPLVAGNNLIKLTATNTEGLANLDFMYVVGTGYSAGGCVVTGVDDQQMTFSLYPNPSKGEFNINTTENNKVRVYDMEGQLVETIQVNGSAKIGQTYEAGIYFLKIENGDSVHSLKIVKE